MSDYTDPELRERLKEEVKAGDKGGKPGQWSARKAQLLVRRYEEEGGGYVGERDERQEHLSDWGEQDWHESEGGDRYLPDVAWKLLSKKEREATEAPKRGADEQFVANTDAAKEARAAAELLTMTADEAVKAVRRMEGASQLDRARTAEQDHGKARKTVLEAIEARR